MAGRVESGYILAESRCPRVAIYHLALSVSTVEAWDWIITKIVRRFLLRTFLFFASTLVSKGECLDSFL